MPGQPNATLHKGVHFSRLSGDVLGDTSASVSRSSNPQSSLIDISTASMSVPTSQVDVREHENSVVSSTSRSSSPSSPSSPTLDPGSASRARTIFSFEERGQRDDGRSLTLGHETTSSAFPEPASRSSVANVAPSDCIPLSTTPEVRNEDGATKTTTAAAIAPSTEPCCTAMQPKSQPLQVQAQKLQLLPHRRPQSGERQQEEPQLQPSPSPGQDIGQRRGERALAVECSTKYSIAGDPRNETNHGKGFESESTLPSSAGANTGDGKEVSPFGSGRGDRAVHPSERFGILEKLGFGSSGSSVYKALDKLDGNKTVVIKKVPLSTLADAIDSTLPGSGGGSNRLFSGGQLGFGSRVGNDVNGSGNERQLLDDHVDYFVSWIVDHCCEEDQVGRETASLGLDHEATHEYQQQPLLDSIGDPESTLPEAEVNEEDELHRLSINPDSAISQSPTMTMVTRRGLRGKDITGKVSGFDQIVKCLGCHRTESELWLSLEFCGAGSVADLIRLSDGPLTEAEIGWMMSQILFGLAYLHSKDHVHGDIKAGNILLTPEGNVKLGGSGSIMNHKEGAGERKRRRRSMTMTEFPASWLAPESIISNPSSPVTPTGAVSSIAPGTAPMTRSLSMSSINDSERAVPEANAETDIWALGVACIELSQGRAPGPDTPILASFGAHKGKPQFNNTNLYSQSQGTSADLNGLPHVISWSNFGQKMIGGVSNFLGGDVYGPAGMGMSEEMWCFISRCLTPEPEARPTVRELLKDPFIEKYGTQQSTELLVRIRRMMEFVDQCATISLDSQSLLTPESPSGSLTLSPSKASHMVNDFKLEEDRWLIPMVRPRVDSVYDESSFFDESGLPISPTDVEMSRPVSDWKHQRISHPVVKQALLCDRAGYITFRHSRSPSLATIIESQLEEQLDDSEDSMKDKLDDEQSEERRGDMALSASSTTEDQSGVEPQGLEPEQEAGCREPVSLDSFLSLPSPPPPLLSSSSSSLSSRPSQMTSLEQHSNSSLVIPRTSPPSSLTGLFSTSRDNRDNTLVSGRAGFGSMFGGKKRRRASLSSWFTSSTPGTASPSSELFCAVEDCPRKASSPISPRIISRTRRATMSNATMTSAGTTSSKWSERSRSASLKVQGLWSWLKEWPRRQKIKAEDQQSTPAEMTGGNSQSLKVTSKELSDPLWEE